jgi:hypothetical protein
MAVAEPAEATSKKGKLSHRGKTATISATLNHLKHSGKAWRWLSLLKPPIK